MKGLDIVKKQFNKNINVVIGTRFLKNDRTLFDDAPILRYKAGTRIGRILIDTGICKSTSEVKGTFWKDYQIPIGFTDLFLDGAKIYKGKFWGKQPHRLTILRLK